MLAMRAWSRGLATEGARACVQWGLEALGRDRMHATVYPENLPSQRVARRLGMQRGIELEVVGLLHELWYVDRSEDAKR